MIPTLALQGIKMPEEKFELYNKVINELLSEAISCTPENWTRGILNITCDGRRIDYALKNQYEEGKAVISDNLKMLCEKTYITFAQAGDVWIEANFTFEENEPGKWKMKTEFKYPENE